MPMSMRLVAGTATSTERRRIRALIAPYGQVGHTSIGPKSIRPGSLRLPADLTRVKLTHEHDRQTVVGHLVDVEDTPQGLFGVFAIANTPAGDTALLEAAERVRDGVSVDLDDVELDGDVVVGAALTAAGLVTFPAFDDGRVLSVAASHHPTPEDSTMPNETPATETRRSVEVTETETPVEAPETDDDGDDDDADDAPESTPGNAGDVSLNAARRPGGLPSPRRTGRLGLTAAMDRLSGAVAERGPAGLVAALADILPAADAGQGILRPQWLGELWTPVAESRDFIESVTRQRLTSGLKVYGWKWATYPEVDVYAGNKTEIPTNTVSLVPAEAPIVRYAGGWDLDRIFVDLGDPGFIQAFFQAAVRDLAAKQEAGVADTLVDEAPEVAATGEGLWAALDQAARTLNANGAQLSFVGISPDLWAEYVTTVRAEVPWWVPGGQAPGLRDSTGSAADVRFFSSPTLPAGTVIAGDRRAVTFYESETIRVQAVNLPQGGIDLAVFAYQSTLVNDTRGLVQVTQGTGA